MTTAGRLHSGTIRPAEMDGTDGMFSRKLKVSQGISRLTLGEIGNRVSAITIDSSKGGAVKKEILQPAGSVFIRPQTTKVKVSVPSSDASSHFQKESSHLRQQNKVVKSEADNSSSKVEWVAERVHPPVSEAGAVQLDPLSHNGIPMDISDHGIDLFSKSLLSEQVEDIDAEDKDNPQLVSIYVNSIYFYMRQLEKKYSIKPNMLEGTDITGKMRAILVDWLCQVHNRFHLLQETLYLTVSIIDRYLQVKPCTRTRLQLVGVTAMLIASKYEEMYAPEVADFVYITDNAYTKKDVRDMEQDILRALDFSFGRPLCLHFLRRNSKAGQVDATKHTLAKYFMELAMLEYDLSHIRPSLIAAAALFLAMSILSEAHWSATLQYYSSYTEEEILPLVHRLAQLVVKAETNKLTAVRTKYSSSKFMKIALISQLKSKLVQELASRSSVISA